MLEFIFDMFDTTEDKSYLITLDLDFLRSNFYNCFNLVIYLLLIFLKYNCIGSFSTFLIKFSNINTFTE